jgi:uncharacterized oxidoreductase
VCVSATTRFYKAARAMKLSNNTILITGGATGIGLALAQKLAAQNTVIVCGRREPALRKAALAVPSLVTRRCDVTDPGDRRALIAWLKSEYGGLNVLINNAGIQRQVDFTASVDASEVEREIVTNLLSPILLISELVPQLAGQANPMIVNVSSGLGFCPRAETPVYSATKAAMHSLSLSLRWQLKKLSIRVVELVPPIVATELAGIDNALHDAPSGGPPVISAEEFATEALLRLEAGEDEIAVGIAEGIRARRDAMFDIIND